MALGISEAVELTRRISELVKAGITLELQERITELREAVLNAKDEVLGLREENQALRAKVGEQEQWAARAAAYQLVTTNGGATVWHTQGPPEHFACPACFEKKTVSILQDLRNYGGTYRCSSCASTYPILPSQSGTGGRLPSVLTRRP